MENLARYIIRASFSQKRMTYQRQAGRVEYRAKDNSQTKVFDALEWLTVMCPIRAKRWWVIMGIIPMRRGGSVKKPLPMITFPDLWDVKRKPPPRAPPIDDFPTYDDHPGPNANDYIRDPDYPAEAYF